jgi:hypothetical protein
MFVPDTDPELRSLLAACQAADDASAPMSALAAWLDRRRDPRGPLVRLGARYWSATRREPPEDLGPAEFDELETRLLAEGEDVLTHWLGFTGDGDTLGVDWECLLRVSIHAFREFPPALGEVIRAGWVWVLRLGGPTVDEALAALLRDIGPVREVLFYQNQSLRDGDLEQLVRIPQLREVDLSETRITDLGLRHLHRVRTLRLVRLEYTRRVTSTGVAALQEALPACVVRVL